MTDIFVNQVIEDFYNLGYSHAMEAIADDDSDDYEEVKANLKKAEQPYHKPGEKIVKGTIGGVIGTGIGVGAAAAVAVPVVVPVGMLVGAALGVTKAKLDEHARAKLFRKARQIAGSFDLSTAKGVLEARQVLIMLKFSQKDADAAIEMLLLKQTANRYRNRLENKPNPEAVTGNAFYGYDDFE